MTCKIFLPLSAALFLGCASRPALKPVNQINEPVFHTQPYATIGLGGGEQLNFDRDFTQRYATPKEALLIQPVLAWFYPVNAWAGFYLLPTYWNFLLTGEQYEAPSDTVRGSRSLRKGKLHLALNGGLSGLAYSGRDGWETQFQASLQGKYRFSERVFSEADYHKLVFDNLAAAIDGWNAGIGYQWLPALSVFFNYNGSVLTLPKYRGATLNGMDFQDNDILNVLSVSTPWYVSAKHVVTPEIAYGHRSSSGREGSLVRGSLQYRFVFD